MRGLGRRRFLLGVASILVAGPALRSGQPFPESPRDREMWRAAGRLLPDSEGAAGVARCWLSQAPSAERDAAAVSRIVRSDVSALPRAQRGSLEQALRHLVRRDFENEDVVRLRGWILSRTEVRLSLLASRPPAPL